METPDYFDDMFSSSPVMAILRGMGKERSIDVAHTAWDLGITSVEIPIQGPADRETLAAVVQAGKERGMDVGAGTLLNVVHVQQALDCGAAFAVSPDTNTSVMQACIDAGLPHLPGVATASDINIAMSLGARWVKAFPASVLGTGWIKAMSGPFPGIKFVATGGMDAHNAEEFLSAGARVIAVGSALEDPQQLALLRRNLLPSVDSYGVALKDSTNAD